MSELDVHLDTVEGPVLVGRLYLRSGPARDAAGFAYNVGWLARPDAYAIDSQLPLLSGTFHTGPDRALFGALGDSAPDRWGAELARRAERRRVAGEGGTARSLGEGALLLAVRDRLRQGALRLRDPASDDFLARGDDGVPPLVELPRLLSAADNLERDAESDEELRLLLEAGSSLGGARPKAQVEDRGRLMIAKFPRGERDAWSVVTWEHIALDMARAGGVRAAASRLVPVGNRQVLLVERFDRGPDEERIGYVSALTMLELTDGDRAAYTDIGAVIEASGSWPGDDLAELWRRVAFSLLVSNTDDHLRNHGFLRAGAGWVLSPAFDLNPNPDTTGCLTTAIADVADPRAEVATLIEVAPIFRVADPAAELRRLLAATAGWRRLAARHGVADEVERMAPAFEHPAREAAERAAG